MDINLPSVFYPSHKTLIQYIHNTGYISSLEDNNTRQHALFLCLDYYVILNGWAFQKRPCSPENNKHNNLTELSVYKIKHNLPSHCDVGIFTSAVIKIQKIFLLVSVFMPWAFALLKSLACFRASSELNIILFEGSCSFCWSVCLPAQAEPTIHHLPDFSAAKHYKKKSIIYLKNLSFINCQIKMKAEGKYVPFKRSCNPIFNSLT